VQIGGGVRVGDAFQAIVGPKLIAIWATGGACRISRIETSVSVPTEERSAHARPGRAAEAGPSEGGTIEDEQSGSTGEWVGSYAG